MPPPDLSPTENPGARAAAGASETAKIIKQESIVAAENGTGNLLDRLDEAVTALTANYDTEGTFFAAMDVILYAVPEEYRPWAVAVFERAAQEALQ